MMVRWCCLLWFVLVILIILVNFVILVGEIHCLRWNLMLVSSLEQVLFTWQDLDVLSRPNVSSRWLKCIPPAFSHLSITIMLIIIDLRLRLLHHGLFMLLNVHIKWCSHIMIHIVRIIRIICIIRIVWLLINLIQYHCSSLHLFNDVSIPSRLLVKLSA